MLNRVIEIVRNASKIMIDASFEAEQKGNKSNWVTSSDIKVEEYLGSELRRLVPGSTFIGEESQNNGNVTENQNNGAKSTRKSVWIIDPIDGTSNYMRGLMLSAISVAYMKDGVLDMGVVYQPYQDEMFAAKRGEGAFLNGKPIHVSDRDFGHSHLCSAMSLYNKELAKPCFKIIERVYAEADDLRRLGSAASELCQLAAGRVELYFEIRLSPWDCAAAAVIIREAGGFVDFMFHDDIYLDGPMGVIAANSKENFDHLKEIVYSEVPSSLL